MSENVVTLPEGKLPPGWTYNIASVDDAPDKHHDILALAIMNIPTREIARRCGCDVSQVRRVLKHGPYREYLGRQRQELFAKQFESFRKLHDAQSEVADSLLDLIRNGKEGTRLSAIKLYSAMGHLGSVTVQEETEEESDEDRLPRNFDMGEIAKVRASVGGVDNVPAEAVSQ